MKQPYIFILTLIIFILIFLGLFFIDIPSPSKIIKEEYNLDIE
tara:strand:- start:326 stop:454 length:129 start_codon:yes stop_codon:yes gene_type:complete